MGIGNEQKIHDAGMGELQAMVAKERADQKRREGHYDRLLRYHREGS